MNVVQSPLLRPASYAPSARSRLIVALTFGIVAGVVAVVSPYVPHGRGGDFAILWNGARALFSGHDPYAIGPHGELPSLYSRLFYPIPALVLAVPMLGLSQAVAGVAFTILSAGVLGFALTRYGYERLPLVLSVPFLVAALYVQTTPIVIAVALFPGAAGLAFVKPNIGAALFAREPRIWAAAAGLLLYLVATLAFPWWPEHWLRSVRSSPIHHAPFMTGIGAVGLASVLRWRRPEARLLFAMTVIPHGLGFYDELPLWLTADSRREAMLLTGASWVGAFAWLAIGNGTFTGSAWWIAFALYVPATALVLRRPNIGPAPAWIERAITSAPQWIRGTSARQ